ncbi:hypothetical protein BU15DRAFT_59175 [Melanogaster broomeanus]|nr:hypothetical protein BU15DRAFT_59175 [Melanogaster broomeanus]
MTINALNAQSCELPCRPGKDSENPYVPSTSDELPGVIIRPFDSEQPARKPQDTQVADIKHGEIVTDVSQDEMRSNVTRTSNGRPANLRIPSNSAIPFRTTTLSPQNASESMSFPPSPLRQGLNPSKGGLPRRLNVVVFGESGVGKSSVINVIAGQTIAKTSNDAVGCTFRHQCYEVTVNGLGVNLWDTAGLDEGTEGTVPATQAEENLRAFLRQITKRDGIDLLMYCIRGTRARKALLRNYNIFYAAICRKKVPVALIVTGLENYEGRWTRGGLSTQRTCDHPAIQNRLEKSRAVLRNLIQKNHDTMTWRAHEDSLISASLPDVRALMGSPRNPEKRVTPMIIIRDTAEQDQRGHLAPGTSPPWEKCTGYINDREYNYVHVNEQLVHDNLTPRLETKPRPDLLVFYAAAESNPDSMWTSLKQFHSSYGGETCPLIVVFRGLDHPEAAAARWRNLSSSHGGAIIATPTFYPGPDCPGELVKIADEALAELIEGKCLVKFEEKSTKLQKLKYLFGGSN